MRRRININLQNDNNKINIEAKQLNQTEYFDLIEKGDLTLIEQSFNNNEISDPNITEDNTNQTVLFHLLIKSKNDDETLKILKFLIEKVKCDPLLIDKNQQNILFYSVAAGFYNCTYYLLTKFKFNSTDLDINLQNPLFYAVKYNRALIGKLLILSGFNINIEDKNGKNLLDYIENDKQKDILKILKKYSINDENKKFEKRLIREGKFNLLNIWKNNNIIEDNYNIDTNKVYCILIKKKNNKNIENGIKYNNYGNLEYILKNNFLEKNGINANKIYNNIYEIINDKEIKIENNKMEIDE
jgi:ankyrin repeat protein